MTESAPDDITSGTAAASSSRCEATLFIWYSTSRSPKPAARPDRDGGHVGLRITCENDSAYLGWWPEHFRVDPDRPTLSRSPWHRLLRFILCYRGRNTVHPVKPPADSGLTVNQIDSVLVQSQLIPSNTPYDQWPERMPDKTVVWPLTPAQAAAGVATIQSLKQTLDPNRRHYHALFCNCATLCVRALRSAGIPLSRPWRVMLWTPLTLWQATK